MNLVTVSILLIIAVCALQQLSIQELRRKVNHIRQLKDCPPMAYVNPTLHIYKLQYTEIVPISSPEGTAQGSIEMSGLGRMVGTHDGDAIQRWVMLHPASKVIGCQLEAGTPYASRYASRL